MYQHNNKERERNNMKALDYIIKENREKKISIKLLSMLAKVIKIVSHFKYNNLKYDFKSLDLIVLSDMINGGSP